MNCAEVSDTETTKRRGDRMRTRAARSTRAKSWAGWLCQTLLLLLPLLSVVTWSTDADAYAWMIRQGYAQCNTCHTDPSGGETLSHMGRVSSQTMLSQNWGDGKVTDAAKYLFGVTEPDWLRLGGSFRGMSVKRLPGEVKVFPMQMDVYGTADFGRVQAGVSLGYANIRKPYRYSAPASLLHTADGEGPNVLSRWHWLGFEINDQMLLRAGRMNLPFGLRTSEHNLFARQGTRTDRESDQQHGLAFSFAGSQLRAELMAVAGNFQIRPDAFRERGYAGYAEYAFLSNLAVGISSQLLVSSWDPDALVGGKKAGSRMAHGLTLRYAPIQPVVLLAEVDVLKSARRSLGYTGFLTLDWEATQGLHLGGTFEALDRGAPDGHAVSAGHGKLQKGYWLTVNWFFFTHFDARIDGVFQDSDSGDLNKMVQAQLHFYL